MANDPYQQFATVREAVDDGFMLHVFGEVDLCEAAEFSAAIDAVAAAGFPVLVNLTECRYIDSSGLGVLARATKRFGTHLKLLVAANSQIARVIGITQLDRVIATSYAEQAAAPHF
jgi:anti-anti-sigma factor